LKYKIDKKSGLFRVDININCIEYAKSNSP